MSVKNTIPNLLTLGNLLSGVFGIVALTWHGFPEVAAGCILLGGLFDVCDGAVARLLKASSPIGAQLDSLADLVTFGVLPGLIAYTYIPVTVHGLGLDAWMPEWIRYAAFLIPAAGAWRLAMFNVTDSNSTKFKGLPIPANGVFWACIPLMLLASTANEFFGIRAGYSAAGADFTLRDYRAVPEAPTALSELQTMLPPAKFETTVDPWWDLLSHGSLVAFFAVLLSVLMVSRVELMSFKMKAGERRPLWIWLGLSVAVIATTSIVYLNPFAAIPIVLLLYLVISIASTLFSRSRHAVQS